MRKFIVIIFMFIVLFMVYDKVVLSEVNSSNNLIRLRVIPNSNSVYDLSMKELVKSYLEDEVYPLVEGVDDVDEVRSIIINNLEKMDSDISDIFVSNGYEEKFTISYGYNYFPVKELNDEVYDDGYYESLVISIGKADGDNFWCLLFPNFCFLESTSDDLVEYDLMLSRLLAKFMN